MSSRRPQRMLQEMGHTVKGTGWEWRQSWFFLLFLTVFGYWIPLVYMGLRILELRWVWYGLLYAGPAALLLLVLGAGGGELHGGEEEAGAAYSGGVRYLWNTMGAFWVFALIHTWNAREEFLVRLAELHFDREDLMELKRARLAAARGETEEAQGADAEAEAPAAPRRLLNVNRVGETELAMLPGLGPERAKQALQLREQLGEYRSFADFAEKMLLTPEAAARLAPLFEPDSGEKALAVPPDDPAYRMLPDGRRVLELNWAGAEALAALPGLGPEVGQRAVAIREGGGPFKSLEDFRYRLALPTDMMIKISDYVSVVSMSTKPGGGKDVKTGGRIVDV